MIFNPVIQTNAIGLLLRHRLSPPGTPAEGELNHTFIKTGRM